MNSRLGVLQRFAAGARRARQGARCELCAGAIAERHRHVVNLDERRLLCTCVACALLFPGSKDSPYRGVPTRARRDPSFTMTEADLTALGVPVGLAFFFRGSRTGQWMAIFPSPAGPTEAELDGDAWSALTARAPLLRGIADDVEALLVHRRRSGKTTALVAPIDACYELAGLLKQSWHGIDGGDGARDAVEGFLGRLEADGTLP